VRVTGNDFSIFSIEHARDITAKKGLIIEYVHQNYLEFKTKERFSLILMIMCDFCTLSPEQRLSLVSKFNSLLTPNGSILVDVYSLIAFNQREEGSSFGKNLQDGFWPADPLYGFLNILKIKRNRSF
jgi:SAM-dependent methyltransferase